MMKKTIRMISLILCITVFAFGAANIVFALSTADAADKPDTSQKCSLKLTYAVDGKKLEGLEIEIWQTASLTEECQYDMTGAFSGYPIEINGIRAQSEWDEVRDTLGAYIAADKIAPTAKQTTDAEGIVRFDSLPVGIYYVRWTGNETVDQVQGFAPFMIAVPGLDEEGKWIYDVDAFPKPGVIPGPDAGEMTLVKLWRDGAKSTQRPAEVSVDIFRNGEFFTNVKLTAERNWTYTWETDESYVWTAVERDIANDYVVGIHVSGNCIRITNTISDGPITPPVTGDSSNLYFWLIVTAVSGMLMIFVGSRRRRGSDE